MRVFIGVSDATKEHDDLEDGWEDRDGEWRIKRALDGSSSFDAKSQLDFIALRERQLTDSIPKGYPASIRQYCDYVAKNNLHKGVSYQDGDIRTWKPGKIALARVEYEIAKRFLEGIVLAENGAVGVATVRI